MPDNGPWITKTIIELEERVVNLSAWLGPLGPALISRWCQVGAALAMTKFTRLWAKTQRKGHEAPHTRRAHPR